MFSDMTMASKEETNTSSGDEDESTRRRKEFLTLCSKGDVESVKTSLVKDPSLINSKVDRGNF